MKHTSFHHKGVACLCASLFLATHASAALTDDLVSYWPLDEIQGGKAPDIVSGMNMDAINLSDADVVDGVSGKAFSFDATKQTMLERLHAEGDPLPAHQYDTLTISFWTKADAQQQFNENGGATNDRRFFSEGATGATMASISLSAPQGQRLSIIPRVK